LIVNIQDDILKLQSLGLLDSLLVDKTTKKNIIWATDAYRMFGEKYARNKPILSLAITGSNDIIKTRAGKTREYQSERTRQHAEVFTPLRICSLMNSYLDMEWFGKDVFFEDGKPADHVDFGDKKWRDYVDSRRMEITCGEAPFIVSRYDVETGESIPIKKRIGFLDRKLRVVNENAVGEAEWLKWALRALQATYGYEFQGDNLLIARVNLLMTMEEYTEEKWQRKPTLEEYRKYINVICWNIWQMDGLSGTIPYHKIKSPQLLLFDLWEDDEIEQPPCRIYDWRARKSVEYRSLQKVRF